MFSANSDSSPCKYSTRFLVTKTGQTIAATAAIRRLAYNCELAAVQAATEKIGGSKTAWIVDKKIAAVPF